MKAFKFQFHSTYGTRQTQTVFIKSKDSKRATEIFFSTRNRDDWDIESIYQDDLNLEGELK